jgi:hypothetical protein
MYLLLTQCLDQNPILFLCGRSRRSNHVTPSSLPHHTLKLSLLFIVILLLTLIFLFIGHLPYILHLITMSLLLFIVGSLKRDKMISQFWVHTPYDGFLPISARRTPLKKRLAHPCRDILELAVRPAKQKNIS